MNGHIFASNDNMTADDLYSKVMEHFDFGASCSRWMTMGAILTEMGVESNFPNCCVLGKMLRKLECFEFRRMHGQRVVFMPVSTII